MDNSFQLFQGSCLDRLKEFADRSVDSIVADPPYELGFMGKTWDKSGIAYNVEVWKEALRVLRPGGHLLAFGGSRTYHRLASAIEDAGFEIRDQIMWVYGSGFPKSLDVSKAIDKAAGAEREVVGLKVNYHSEGNRAGTGENHHGKVDGSFSNPEQAAFVTAPSTLEAKQWDGWGTALKPAHEPIVVARRPLIGTVVQNVLEHGTGALNIDGCRIEAIGYSIGGQNRSIAFGSDLDKQTRCDGSKGRWPANLIHDGSEEVLSAFPDAPGQMADAASSSDSRKTQNVYGVMKRGSQETSRNSDNAGIVGFKMKPGARRLDEGSAARFFYCAKANKKDRGEGNNHPTVKPTELMRYLVRLVTPPGGIVLDPFCGSGSTGKASLLEGFRFIGIDLSAEYLAIAERRIREAAKGPVKANRKARPETGQPLPPPQVTAQSLSLF